MTDTDPKIRVFCKNETDKLEEVVIGYTENFHKDPSTIEIINNTQTMYFGGNDDVDLVKLKEEFDNFKKIMEENSVIVHIVTETDAPDQLSARDIGFVILDYYFVASMKYESRRKEIPGMDFLTKNFEKVIKIPNDVVIEGGDIVVDKNCVFVGIGQRTNIEGFNFLKNFFKDSDLKFVAVPIKCFDDGVDCLHLDCTFVPVAKEHCLIYPDGIKEMPEEIKNLYKWIEINLDEQADLATNVLSLSPTKVLSRSKFRRINEELRKINLDVIEFDFEEAPKSGGAIRCSSLALRRI